MRTRVQVQIPVRTRAVAATAARKARTAAGLVRDRLRTRPAARGAADAAAIAAAGGADLRTVDPPRPFGRAAPTAGEGGTHWKFLPELGRVSPGTFAVALPGGRAVGPDGAVAAADGRAVRDLSVMMGPDGRDPLAGRRVRRAARAGGSVGAAASLSADTNYFHWMFDALPRVDLIRRAGFEPDRWYAPLSRPFHAETLARAGVDPARVIDAAAVPHVRADRLIAASPPGLTGNPTPATRRFLRGLFAAELEGAGTPGARPSRRVYLSRADARGRRVLDEDALFGLLAGLGYERHTLGGRSAADQARLFAGATHVVAPHGAGLTNLVFCAPGARVLELFHPGYVNVCYWSLANLGGVGYHWLAGEGAAAPPGRCPALTGADIRLSPAALGRALRAFHAAPLGRAA